VFAYFVIDDLILLFVAFIELLVTLYASFLFMDIILLFMVTCRNLLVKSSPGGDLKSPLYGDVSEKHMMGMFDLIFYSYTNFIRIIEMFVESALATVSERFTIADHFFFFW
jgi:hypothetical protein